MQSTLSSARTQLTWRETTVPSHICLPHPGSRPPSAHRQRAWRGSSMTAPTSSGRNTNEPMAEWLMNGSQITWSPSSQGSPVAPDGAGAFRPGRPLRLSRRSKGR
jgi:hypothetical protein